MPDSCPVCNEPLSSHPDGLACCPYCITPVRLVLGQHPSAVCDMCGIEWPTYAHVEALRGAVNCRAPHAETLALMALLDKMRSELTRIADDYVPDNDGQAPLALSEMREALHDLLAELKEPAHD